MNELNFYQQQHHSNSVAYWNSVVKIIQYNTISWFGSNFFCSRVSGYLLQTAQTCANAGVTETCHCQGACRLQWFFYVPNWDGTDINVLLRFTRDIQSPMLRTRFVYHNCRYRGSNPPARQPDVVTTTPPTLSMLNGLSRRHVTIHIETHRLSSSCKKSFIR